MFDAIVIAGYQEDSPDLLAQQLGAVRKTLIPIAGQPMVWHVVRALRNSQYIERILVVGLSPEDGVDFGCEVDYVHNASTLWENAFNGVQRLRELKPQSEMALITTGDVPMIKPPMVDWFVEACAPYDLDGYYCIVERQTIERSFPNSQRGFVPLKDGDYCGGDLFMVGVDTMLNRRKEVEMVVRRRKSPLQQVMLLGWRTTARFLMRRIDVAEAEQVVGRVFNIRCEAIISPYPEIGMDVDRPHQLEIVREHMDQQTALGGSPA